MLSWWWPLGGGQLWVLTMNGEDEGMKINPLSNWLCSGWHKRFHDIYSMNEKWKGGGGGGGKRRVDDDDDGGGGGLVFYHYYCIIIINRMMISELY